MHTPSSTPARFFKNAKFRLVVKFDVVEQQFAVVAERTAKITVGHEQRARRVFGEVQQRKFLYAAYLYVFIHSISPLYVCGLIILNYIGFVNYVAPRTPF